MESAYYGRATSSSAGGGIVLVKTRRVLILATYADPVTAARAVLATLAKHPPAAYAATKNDLREGSMDTTPAEREAFIDDVVPFWTSPELKAMIRKLLGG